MYRRLFSIILPPEKFIFIALFSGFRVYSECMKAILKEITERLVKGFLCLMMALNGVKLLCNSFCFDS